MPNASHSAHVRRAYRPSKIVFSIRVFAVLLFSLAVPSLIEWRIAWRGEEDALRARDAIRIRRERAERDMRELLVQMEQPEVQEALRRKIEEEWQKWNREELKRQWAKRPRSYLWIHDFDDRIPLAPGVL
jgi:hypothetical protein